MKLRKLNHGVLLFVALACPVSNIVAGPSGSAFTYQGRLTSGTNVASGLYDFRFTLFDAATGGSLTGGPVTNPAVAVAEGYLTTSVDFGVGVFAGEARWLEVCVRTNGGGPFTTLMPRQELKPAPYALYAPSAGVAATATFASGVAAGAVGTAGLENSAVDSSKIADGSITGSDLSPVLLNDTFWKLRGNAGTMAGINFLGTTDDQPLELKVHGQRAFRLEPTTNSPNVIGGYGGNSVDEGTTGATISGGGAADAPNLFSSTSGSSRSLFGTIGGGLGNYLDTTPYGTISGGSSNSLRASEGGTISGGCDNRLGAPTLACSIGGGTGNSARYAISTTIAGGAFNRANDSDHVSIGGGIGNTIDVSECATISGGSSNAIAISGYATIGGGRENDNRGWDSTISGGAHNFIMESGAHAAAIGGGSGNWVTARTGTIAGGESNVVSARLGTIPGGAQASARNYGQMAYASGQFAATGDAQTSVLLCRGTTTDATQAELFLDGSSERMLMPANSTWALDILVTGRAANGNSAAYHFLGAAQNNNGISVFTAAYQKNVLAETQPAWDANLFAPATNGVLMVVVQGEAATSIRWVASVRTAEVLY